MKICTICGASAQDQIQSDPVCPECHNHIRNSTLPKPNIDALFSLDSLDGILRRAVEFTELSEDQIKRHSKKREIVEVRQCCMHLAKNNTRESLSYIGRFFGEFDHTTVLHAIKTISNLIETDSSFRDKYKKLLDL